MRHIKTLSDSHVFFWCFISFGCRIRTPLCGLSFFGVYACLMASWDATPDFFSWMWWSKLQAVSTMKIHSFPRIMIYLYGGMPIS